MHMIFSRVSSCSRNLEVIFLDMLRSIEERVNLPRVGQHTINIFRTSTLER